MPERKQKRAKNIKGKELRALAAEALRIPREPTINLARRLATDINWPGPAPAVEVLKKKITAIRQKGADYSDLDASWSVVTMATNELPPETLPVVMKLGQYFRQREGRPMSIREALWAARLSALSRNGVSFKDYAGHVIDYAALEKINEALGRSEQDELVTDSEMYRDMTGLGHEVQVIGAAGKGQKAKLRGL
jgi:hypothetical protein